MNNCIFCKIVAGKSPAYKVYEDELFLAFLDINPRTRGHTLLIPKKHYVWIYDVPEFTQCWDTVLKITRAMQKVFKPGYITYFTYGLEVPHAHIHILPRSEGERGFVPDIRYFSPREMTEITDKIKQGITLNSTTSP